MCDKRAGKEVIFKPLRARDRSQGWTVNRSLLPRGGFCKYWKHIKWLIVVLLLSPIILTCSIGICGFPAIQFSRHSQIVLFFWRGGGVKSQSKIPKWDSLPVKQGFLSILEVWPNTKMTGNNKMSHPTDIQGQSYNSGCLSSLAACTAVRRALFQNTSPRGRNKTWKAPSCSTLRTKQRKNSNKTSSKWLPYKYGNYGDATRLQKMMSEKPW